MKLSVKKWLRRHRAALVFFGVALVVLGPLLKPGYILTLDMVFVPRMPLPAGVSSSYLEQLAFWAAAQILPAHVVQKILLIGVLWLTGFGAYRLARHYTSGQSGLGSYVAGLFYMVNPFTYDRFMAGQYNVLFGYALLSWFALAFIRCLERPQWKRALVALVWSVAISIVSIHSIIPAAIIAVGLLARYIWLNRPYERAGAGRKWVLGTAGMPGLIAVGWLVSNSYWLWQLFNGQSRQAETISGIGAGDRMAFATSGSGWLEQLGYVARLQGFWAERHGLFVLPQHDVPGWLWWLALGLIWGLVVAGIIVWWRSRYRGEAVLYAGLIVLAALLASGIGNGWLAEHVPLYAGYREPQKFVALLIVAMVPLLAVGCNAAEQFFVRRVGKALRPVLVCAVFAAPVFTASTMPLGMAGQLEAVQYPAGWEQVNQKLNDDKQGGATVFLPWHMYLFVDFAGRVTANPAAHYFDRQVLISDDPELKGVSRTPSTLPVAKVDHILSKHDPGTLAHDLRQAGVRHIILARTADYEKYGYVRQAPGVKAVVSTSEIELFEIP